MAGVCWWCGDPRRDLFPMDGSVLVGASELRLPDRIRGEDRGRHLIGEECASLFAGLRTRRDLEMREAAAASVMD